MTKFPVDAPRRKVIKALVSLGFQVVREKEHNLHTSWHHKGGVFGGI